MDVDVDAPCVMDNLVLVPTEPDAPHEHSYETVVTAPTCTEGGYTTYTCACGDTYVADETAALGHSFADGVCSVCGEADPDYVKPEEPKTYVFEFDAMTYNPMPHWSEIPFTHGALPDGVTDKSAAHMGLNLDEQVSVTLTVDKAGTYLLTFNAVTNSSGPILQISVNGQDVGGKIKMGDSNQWKYISFNLGYVTLKEGENTLSIRSVDVNSEASFILDNVVLTPVDVDAATEFSYEFDQMTFVQNPSWMDKPFINGALPEGVTDGKAIFATIRLDTETVMTFSVPKDGTYSIIFNGVTDNNGPTLQFLIDGSAIGDKVNMAKAGGWACASFDLGKLTLTAGVHTLTIRGVDVDVDAPCVMDNLVLVPTEPDEPVEPEEPESYVYEFDTIEFVTKPTWSEIPFIHGALPENVTEGKAIFATIRLDTETVMNFSVAKEGTYNIILIAVTDTNGPTLQFLIDGTAIGDKVNMAKAGGWAYASFDLGKLTLTAGVHTLTIRGVDVDVDSPCVMDNLVLVPAMA